MKSFFPRKRRSWAAMAMMGFLAMLLSAPSLTGMASAATGSVRPGHVITPLPGCAVTYTPKVAQPDTARKCLVTVAQAEQKVARSGNSAIRQTAEPSTVTAHGCYFDYYQNGPWLSTAWGTGWGVCVATVTNAGYYWVPSYYNDQASSWDSCTDGYFYANQPGTSPAVYFPGNTWGNFPYGSVPNDSLSSALAFYGDYSC